MLIWQFLRQGRFPRPNYSRRRERHFITWLLEKGEGRTILGSMGNLRKCLSQETSMMELSQPVENLLHRRTYLRVQVLL